MLFNSSAFLIFFPIVVLAYYIIPRKIKNYWLLAASLFFYACWNVKYLALLLFSIVVTYVSAILMDKADTPRRKRVILVLCLVLNFAVLFFFKYFNFLSDSVVRAGARFGLIIPSLHHSFLLPVGISFYTFQALSYSVDVYKGEISPEKNFFKYALFVSFFPQLVAGPIERSGNLLPQFDEEHRFDATEVKHGLELMLWGFFEKLVIADRVAIFVNQIYDHYTGYAFFEIALATIGFAIQIYCDFGGYSHIAIGAAEVLGIKLSRNFEQPYLAVSIKDFWRRWHISLSTWFRDYVYIPLGGNRKGKLRKYINLMITFLVSGLWHGASWHYVIWGGLHGLYQIVGELTSSLRAKAVALLRIKTDCESFKAIRIVLNFLFVDFAWIFFRASRFSEAVSVIRQMISTFNPWVLFDQSLYNCGLDRINVFILIVSVLILIIVDLYHEKHRSFRETLDRQNAICRFAFYYLGVMLVLIFGIYGPTFDASKFIYFQF